MTKTTSGFWTADRRLWLKAGDTDEFGHTHHGTEVVPDGDPDARFLLCSPGDEVPMAVVNEYKLLALLDGLDTKAKAVAPAEDKAKAPAEDKAAKPAAKGKGKK